MTDFRDIPLDLIDVGARLRSIDQQQVEAIKSSVLDVGLLNPISVYPRSWTDDDVAMNGFGLVAGGHRLECFRQLGYDEIPAVVLDLSDLERQIAECDENLAGPKLTASELAMFTQRRKEAYEALHPSTKNGAVGNGREKLRQSGEASSSSEINSVDRFTADTAVKTGQSERVVQRHAERGEKVIAEVLELVRGTKLDTGAYLDKIKGLTPNDQVTAAKRDLAHLRAEERRIKEAVDRPGGIDGRYRPAPDSQAKLKRFVAAADALLAFKAEPIVKACPVRERASLYSRLSPLVDLLHAVLEGIEP